MGIQHLMKVKKFFHIKFAWRLLTVENMWNKFFKAKYVNSKHLSQLKPKQTNSWFWIKCCSRLMVNAALRFVKGTYPFGLTIG